MSKELLKFSRGSAKLPKSTLIFSLPAGHTCPGANECFSKANKDTGKIKDGPNTKFRCYAASMEAVYPSCRQRRWDNFVLLTNHSKSVEKMAELISDSVDAAKKKDTERVRIHESGDFFSQDYMEAWMLVASYHTDIVFYAYTKSLHFWVNLKDRMPSNFRLVASRGGKLDYLIHEEHLPYAEVIFHPDDANGLPIEHAEDEHAWAEDRHSFALVLHGTQPAGSEAALARKKMAAEGLNFGYSNKRVTQGKHYKAKPATPAQVKTMEALSLK